jgi:hypothetical protein
MPKITTQAILFKPDTNKIKEAYKDTKRKEFTYYPLMTNKRDMYRGAPEYPRGAARLQSDHKTENLKKTQVFWE